MISLYGACGGTSFPEVCKPSDPVFLASSREHQYSDPVIRRLRQYQSLSVVSFTVSSLLMGDILCNRRAYLLTSKLRRTAYAK